MPAESSDEIELGPEEVGTPASTSGKAEVSGRSPRAPRARRRRHRNVPVLEKELYSKSEAARYLGVAEITITRYLQKGILYAHRLPTPGQAPGGVRAVGAVGAPESNRYDYGRLRIEKSELDRYLESVDRKAEDGSWHVRAITSTEVQTSTDEGAGGRPRYGDNSEIMTREEAALRLGVSWRTIMRYIESGKLRLAGYFRCPDSYTRAHVYRSEVEALISPSNKVER